jgi:two-component system sensor histidine kinase MprB
VTLRSRLVLLFGLVALSVSAVVGASSYRATSSEVSASTDDFLQQRAADVADGNRASPDGRRGQRQNDAPLLPFDPDAIVQTTTRDGVVSGTSGGELPITDAVSAMIDLKPNGGRRVQGVFEDISIDGEPYRMYTQALPEGGAIQVARSTAEDDDLLGSLLSRFGVIALVATIVASLIGWWLARRTTRPLRRLADVAATVADTRDFSIVVPVERSDEIGTLASSMRTMLEALETSREQQQRLVQDASHELRTPLTSLRANVAMLERIEESPIEISAEDRSAVLAAISAEVAELGALFDELIDLATDSDDRSAPLVPLRLDEVATRAVKRWEQRTGRRIDVTVEAVTVNGNEAMLERAVTNLIGNAHKFSPPDAPIEVVVREGSVAVRDGGPGIPEADRARVFDRFHRAETTRSMPGSGLGLAIVATIVDHHGGEVWAGESDRGGADVGFRLPIVSG